MRLIANIVSSLSAQDASDFSRPPDPNQAILLALILGPYLYQRIRLVLALSDNAPGKLQAISNFASYEVKFQDQLRNCEDVILLEGLDGMALLSCDEGRDRWNTVMGIFKNPQHQGTLHIYNLTTPSLPPQPLHLHSFPPAQTDFHPLGIAHHPPSRTLHIINHATTGSTLELFTLHPHNATATHLQTITHPAIHSPNSLTVIDEHNIYLTNDHKSLSRYHPWLAKLETWLAVPGGNVLHFHIPSGKARVLARVPFANGVERLNETALAVASTSASAVLIYEISGEGDKTKLLLKTQLPVPFLPDNLSVDSAGKLLIAGHPHAFSMIEFAESRDACFSGDGEVRERACEVRAGTAVAEWEGEGEVKMLWMGEEFATGSTAVRDGGRGVGVVSGLYERGVLIWRE